MSAVDDLQAAASRYAGVASFGAVAATGAVDTGTVNAVQNALAWVRDHVPDESSNAATLMGRLSDANSITTSASGLATYFNQIADQQNLGGSNLTFTSTFKQLQAGVPSWIIYAAAGAVLLGVAVMIVRHQLKPSKGARRLRPAMAGFDALYDGHGRYDDNDDVEDAEYE